MSIPARKVVVAAMVAFVVGAALTIAAYAVTR